MFVRFIISSYDTRPQLLIRLSEATLHDHILIFFYLIGMQLSVRELAWLAELPFYIRSVDLGCVFVHAGFKAGADDNLQQQQ